ncbi:MAG: hypothetical protein IPH89_00385 [Bacteroidetes bacterium]|nr:hypothetical protein [Bacteroidota bacterium]
MKKFRFVVFFIFSLIQFVSAQSDSTITVSFVAHYNGKNVDLSDSSFVANDSNHLQIDALRFYVSNICFLKNGTVVLPEKNSFHLIDASNKNSQTLSIKNTNKINFDELSFSLGIDSTTNVSGAMGADLDPTKGMYWTWQSGYINFKLEGKSNNCPTRNHAFEFHLGGYQTPFNCLKTATLKTTNQKIIIVVFDINQFLSVVDLSTLNQIMSPSKTAVLLSEQAIKSFKIIDP